MKGFDWMGWVVLGLVTTSTATWAAVDINSADAKTLEQELGLPREKVIKMIDRREQQPFTSVDDLSSVDGFTSQDVNQLRGKISTGSATAKGQSKATTPKVKKPKKQARKKGTSKAKSSAHAAKGRKGHRAKSAVPPVSRVLGGGRSARAEYSVGAYHEARPRGLIRPLAVR